jgi:beta-phosphoglucomutase-like phosphatase (HAD superfamily)
MRPPPADPSNVLVFEDSINGVLSGLAAGCQVVWVPQKEFMTPGWEKNAENFRQHSDLFAETLDSLENFRPEKYGLPAFNN